MILSRGVFFSHDHDEEEGWVLESDTRDSGTRVFMRINNHTARTTRKIFDEFSSLNPEEGISAFDETIVPVKLARYGDDNLVSRSQAKRLLTRYRAIQKCHLGFF